MLGRVISPNYLDPSISIMDMHIKIIVVHNRLIELGDTINSITKETMLNLNLQGVLRKTIMVLQLANKSIVSLERVIKNMMVSMDS